MKIYIGMRSEITGLCSVRILENGDARALPLRLDIARHSPDGFGWGHGGIGPSQLAIALIADALPLPRAGILRLHQRFKWRVVAKFPHKGWRLSEIDVLGAISQILVEDGVDNGDQSRP